jgi:tRNA pseudouridine38-40 synthase
MPCYKLTVEYDGTRFVGFQRQTPNESLAAAHVHQLRPTKHRRFERSTGKVKPTLSTIQDCLEMALLGWTGYHSVDDLKLKGAGRTDKGVHARGQVVAIQVPRVLEGKEEWELCRAANSRLPDDVVVFRFELCDKDDFCPRNHVKLKQYSYTLKYRRKVFDDNGNVLPLSNAGMHALRRAHEPSCIWNCPWALNDDVFAKLCAVLQGQHDFSCFVHKKERRKRDNNMELSKFEVITLKESNEEAPIVTVMFVLEAKGFRRTMVRNLVGFVVDVSRGKLAGMNHVDAVLSGTDDASNLVNAAPASGLCLVKVEY